jgi:CO dehydrogenase/acetyl-CoA synthase beta subunit|tara:strand:- start:196 stop:450 length:255 start_codon:yes stop_codon:yes gene_type:complete
MTYVYETKMGGKHLVVEYCFSSVSDSIKVVDMTADGKFHRLNWMSDAGRDKLMVALDKDMEDRMCGTGEYSTEVNLERDIPYGL